MASDLTTFLDRIGQADLPYQSYGLPADADVAARVPLFAQLLRVAEVKVSAVQDAEA